MCGEGGEYETLTLDCRLFTRGRVILKEWTTQLHSPGIFASVGVLHPLSYEMQPKHQSRASQRSASGREEIAELGKLSVREEAADGEAQEAESTELAGKVFMVPKDFQAKYLQLSPASLQIGAVGGQCTVLHTVSKGFITLLTWLETSGSVSAQAGFDEEAFCSVLTQLEQGMLSTLSNFDIALKLHHVYSLWSSPTLTRNHAAAVV